MAQTPSTRVHEVSGAFSSSDRGGKNEAKAGWLRRRDSTSSSYRHFLDESKLELSSISVLGPTSPILVTPWIPMMKAVKLFLGVGHDPVQ